MGGLFVFPSRGKDELVINGEQSTTESYVSSSEVQKHEISSSVDPTIPDVDDRNNDDFAMNFKVFRGFSKTSYGKFRKPTDNSLDIKFMNLIVTFSKSVGKIVTPLATATGFRVGDRYIMTAYHIVEPFLREMNPWPFINNPNVYIDFESEDNQNTPVIFTFRSILYTKENLDVIVLEINLENTTPPPAVSFFNVRNDMSLTFVGHNDGRNKKCDPDCFLMEPTEQEVEYAINYCKQNKLPENGYLGLRNTNFIRFNCSFQHGASGSPGVILCKTMCVCVMLLKGYPSFYWDLPCDKQKWFPNDLLIEEGVSMERVMLTMKNDNLQACMEVFPQCFNN